MRLTWILLIVLTLSIAPLCSASINGVAGGKFAPDPTLIPYSMTPFPYDSRDNSTLVSYVDSPLEYLAGEESRVIFSPISLKINDPSNWTATADPYANTYTGKIYFTPEEPFPSSMTLDLPSNTVAFYFYATANSTGPHDIEATAHGTSLTQTTSVSSSAKYYGFYADPGEFLTKIELNNVVGDLNKGFELGEFGIAKAPELGNTPPEAVEYIIAEIEGMDSEDAEKEMDKAVAELNKAIDEFNNDRIDKAFDKIAKAVKRLMKAQEKGVDTQGVIDELVALVQGIAEKAKEDAIAAVEPDNLHAVKAQEHYDKALQKIADGEYDRAIKEFKKAYREAMKALGE